MRRKRSITINNHVTAISIEAPFWDAVKAIAADRHMTLVAMVSQIDRQRTRDIRLSDAIRVEVLQYFQSKAEEGRAA